MTNFRRTTAALTLAVTATMGMSACNFGSKEAPKAKDAWNKTQDRVGTYKSLTVDGNGTDNGKPISMTIKGTVDGTKQVVTGKQGDGSFEMRTVDGKTYMKGNEAYFTSTSTGTASATDKAFAKAAADKWIDTSTTGSSSSSTDTALLKEMIKDLRDDSDADSKKLLSDKATVEADKVDGKGAWKITSEDKKFKVWVSDDDKYDLLKAEGLNDKSKDGDFSTITFKDPNADVKVEKPADAKSMMDLLTSK